MGIHDMQKEENEVVDFIYKHKLSLTPNNFKVAFDFLNGSIESLKKSVNLSINENGLSNVFMDKIYEQYFGSPYSVVDKISKIIDALIKPFSSKEDAQSKSSLSLLEKEVNELRSQLENEKNRSLTDALTGLGNRARFESKMSAMDEIKNSLTTSMLIIDIDHFKKVNDQFGHQAGDAVIKEVAHAIKSAVTDKGHLATRYGGEEFALFINGDEDVALCVAEDIQKRISKIKVHVGHAVIIVTTSMGVCEFSQENSTKKTFMDADRCLYYSKENGRNQITYQTSFKQMREMG